MYMLSIFNVSKTINEVTWVYNTLTASFIKIEEMLPLIYENQNRNSKL